MSCSIGRLSQLSCLFLLLAGRLIAVESARPNVLFLFTDDQRRDTISAMGNPAIETPNLDALVKRGFAFENAYCMGSMVPAVCSPSRHQVLSGLSLFHFEQRKDPNGTFGDSFTKGGYDTWLHTKKGNEGTRFHKGFQTVSYSDEDANRLSGHHGREEANTVIEFLNTQWDRQKPFCVYLGFAGPHDPRVAASEWMGKYQQDQIRLPDNYKPFHPFNNGELFVRDERLAPWPRTPEVVRGHLHDYYACITSIDFHIGRIIAELKKLNQLENTLIVFSADHGLAIGSHGLFGKQNVYEHSMGAPLVFAGPGVPHGKTAAFAYLFDIYPTLADLAKVAVPADLDGKSLAGVIAGKTAGVRDSVFLGYRDIQRAYREGNWKLIHYPKVNVTELYDLGKDPNELNNVLAANSKRATEMMFKLAAAQKELGDPHPLSVERPMSATVDEEFFRNAPPVATPKNKKAAK